MREIDLSVRQERLLGLSSPARREAIAAKLPAVAASVQTDIDTYTQISKDNHRPHDEVVEARHSLKNLGSNLDSLTRLALQLNIDMFPEMDN